MFATNHCKQGKVKCQTETVMKRTVYTTNSKHASIDMMQRIAIFTEHKPRGTSHHKYPQICVLGSHQGQPSVWSSPWRLAHPQRGAVYALRLSLNIGWVCKHLTIIGSLHYHFMTLSIVHYWSAILELMRLQSLKLKMLYQYFPREFGKCCRGSSLFVYDSTIFYQYALVNAGCVAMLAWVGPVMVQLYHQNAPTNSSESLKSLKVHPSLKKIAPPWLV